MVLDTQLHSVERPRRCVFDYSGGPSPDAGLVVEINEALSLDMHVTGINAGTSTARHSLFDEGVRGVVRAFLESQGGQFEISILPGGIAVRAIASFSYRTEIKVGFVVSRLKGMLDALHRRELGGGVSIAAAAWVTPVARFDFPMLRQILEMTGELPPPALGDGGMPGGPHLSWG